MWGRLNKRKKLCILIICIALSCFVLWELFGFRAILVRTQRENKVGGRSRLHIETVCRVATSTLTFISPVKVKNSVDLTLELPQKRIDDESTETNRRK